MTNGIDTGKLKSPGVDSGTGAPLGFAAIAVGSIDKSIAFYRDVIGFDVIARGLADAEAVAMLGLPQGTTLDVARLSACGLGIGQLLLFAPDVTGRTPTRRPGDRMTYGLWNINFYVDDIHAVAAALRATHEFWSEPVRYQLSAAAGEPIEVVFEGPDAVAINLVQPTGGAESFVGRIKAAADQFGKTRTGFTPISTSAHCVHSVEQARDFYQAICGSQVVLDEHLGRPETNHFLDRPHDAVGHTIFLSGDHFFGKLCLSQPLNFAVPDRVADARIDGIGYFAQGFFVPNLPRAIEAGLAAGGLLISQGPMALPGFEGEAAALLRAPGSGALAWLIDGVGV